jgi:hypothetical protein
MFHTYVTSVYFKYFSCFRHIFHQLFHVLEVRPEGRMDSRVHVQNGTDAGLTGRQAGRRWGRGELFGQCGQSPRGLLPLQRSQHAHARLGLGTNGVVKSMRAATVRCGRRWFSFPASPHAVICSVPWETELRIRAGRARDTEQAQASIRKSRR